MTRLPRAVLLSLLAMLAWVSPVRAEAPDVQQVLNVLAQYGIIDQDLASAGPVVQCVIDGKAVESCVQQLAADKADALLKSDSKLVLAADLVKAANSGDWIRLLDLAGTKVLKVVACELAVPIPGPVVKVVCSSTFDYLVNMAGTIVAEAVDAIADNAYWRLVTVVGPDVACKIIPDDVGEVRDVVCGALGKIWQGISQTAGAVVTGISDVADAFSDGLQDVFDFFDDVLGTAPSKQSPRDYYLTYVASYYMNGIHTALGQPAADMLSTPEWIYKKCMEYYDEDDGCTSMRNRYVSDVAAYASALKPWPEAYFAAELKPALPYYYVKWVQAGKPTVLVPAYQEMPLSPCVKTVRDAYPYPSSQYKLPLYQSKQQLKPKTRACLEASKLLLQALAGGQTRFAWELADLKNRGCQIEKGGKPTFPFSCTSVDGFQRCEALFATTELVRPSLAWITFTKPDSKLCNFVLPAKQPNKPLRQAPEPPVMIDLLAEPPVQVLARGNAIPAEWGHTVELSAAAKLDSVPGSDPEKCRFAIRFTVRNAGTGTSPAFENHLGVNQQVLTTRKVDSLAAGATVQQQLSFEVGSGESVVSLQVDGAKEVTEAQEGNNGYRLRVHVNGACGQVLNDSMPTTATAKPGAIVLPQIFTVEGEALAEAHKFKASAGRVTTGGASSYARTGEAPGGQLVWSGGGPGSVLELSLDVPAAATYVMELDITGGPDYGDIEVSVDGERGPLIRGFSPRSTPSRPLQAGRFSLAAGERTITFKVVDKNRASTGYALGLDFIRLYPVGPPRSR